MGNKINEKIRVGFLLEMPRSGGGSFQWMINILDALASYREIEIFVYHKKNYENLEEIQKRYQNLTYISIGQFGHIAKAIFKRLFFVAPFLASRMPFLLASNIYFRKDAIDLLVLPTLFVDAVASTAPTIFFLADIGHRTHPEFPELASGLEAYRREQLIKYGLRNALTIVVESTQLKNDVMAIYGADRDNIFVIPQCLGMNRDSADNTSGMQLDNEGLMLPEKYFYYPAQLWPHKNHLNLLRAFKEIESSYPDLHLILTGSRKSGDDLIFQEIKVLGLEGKVKYFGYVPDAGVQNLYKNAIALIMPTFLGPTNIPTLEAFHYGCPAIISDLPGVHEQAGDAAIYFNPSSISDIKNSMQKILLTPGLRDQMVKKGHERIKFFYFNSYKRHFHNVLDKTLHSIKAPHFEGINK
ncbi:glycosyltransferase family 4 protein [Polynucleobacter brandtiae]|uniref:Glycosyltransferase involved in cell wall biosynthesis n=1 Tax=Polynucleobacter brandtiae TaxID=1938816 RepID=A0A2M8VJI7_9BURK|nr:glycosyltransferase family 1 protein [Polynucleobacter brandtiae]PJI77160.1 glycosyltransferase involved in cell wall biosynthesis [Polynucleobacter brandtiae]